MSWKFILIHAVVGVLQRHNKLLVAERPLGKPYSGYWEFPGGKVEAHETAEEAVKRELYEELGIQVIAANPCFQHIHHYPDKVVLLDVWYISQFIDEPQGKEGQALKWVSYEELIALRLLEGNLQILDRVKQDFFEEKI